MSYGASSQTLLPTTHNKGLATNLATLLGASVRRFWFTDLQCFCQQGCAYSGSSEMRLNSSSISSNNTDTPSFLLRHCTHCVVTVTVIICALDLGKHRSGVGSEQTTNQFPCTARCSDQFTLAELRDCHLHEVSYSDIPLYYWLVRWNENERQIKRRNKNQMFDTLWMSNMGHGYNATIAQWTIEIHVVLAHNIENHVNFHFKRHDQHWRYKVFVWRQK